ncbi:MAG: tRNA adenosine(34) deaminase TadA [Tissierellia bacterium]|nr:tRNA adenosine(34) deaminase TadA [Tissierellia bacterium]
MDTQKEFFMREAIQEAKISYRQEDVPIGAVLVLNGQIIGRGHNQKERTNNPLKHAEIMAIEEGVQTLDSYHLEDCILYVTLEPCLMCVGALINARVGHLVFGAYNHRFGAVHSHVKLLDEGGFNHQTTYEGGILEKECSALLSSFFRELREQKNTKK